jgi:hypothetical protein
MSWEADSTIIDLSFGRLELLRFAIALTTATIIGKQVCSLAVAERNRSSTLACDSANPRASARSFCGPDFGHRRVELIKELKRRAGRHRFQVEGGVRRLDGWSAQIGAADQAGQA